MFFRSVEIAIRRENGNKKRGRYDERGDCRVKGFRVKCLFPLLFQPRTVIRSRNQFPETFRTVDGIEINGNPRRVARYVERHRNVRVIAYPKDVVVFRSVEKVRRSGGFDASVRGINAFFDRRRPFQPGDDGRRVLRIVLRLVEFEKRKGRSCRGGFQPYRERLLERGFPNAENVVRIERDRLGDIRIHDEGGHGGSRGNETDPMEPRQIVVVEFFRIGGKQRQHFTGIERRPVVVVVAGVGDSVRSGDPVVARARRPA